jgi:hypothetical protein
MLDKCEADRRGVARYCVNCGRPIGRARNPAHWCSECRRRWPISYWQAAGHSEASALRRWNKRQRWFARRTGAIGH